MLETLLGSKLRARVLGWLFSHPDERYYVRQLTSLVKGDSTNVSRELARLEKAGILISTAEGKQKYYQANRNSPVFAELKGLCTKSSTKDGTGSRFQVPKKAMAEFCRRHHIRKLSLFGSVLRHDFHPDSDIDVLVEFEAGHVPGFFALSDMESELSTFFTGRKVDLRTPHDLSRYFREQVIKDAKVQYAKAR